MSTTFYTPDLDCCLDGPSSDFPDAPAIAYRERQARAGLSPACIQWGHRDGRDPNGNPCPWCGPQAAFGGLGERGVALQEFVAEQVVRSSGLVQERLREVLVDLCWAELEAKRK